MQDFTGVPAVVDLAAMRDAVMRLGGDPKRINPLQRAEMVVDHSVQVDAAGSEEAFGINSSLEFERNGERYAFLKWGQAAFENFRVVPPETGIVHQVNLEHLAQVVMDDEWAYPDTVVGTDSHTTMINGVGVLGWGVGGIEAEAAMLGQPVSMLIPQVVGVRLAGQLPEGVTATDLVLRVVERLRQEGVVGKFVEFFGPGLGQLSLADRATLANMAPEYGATCGIFPVDERTIDYLRLTGRDEDSVNLVEAYMREQGLFHDGDQRDAEYSGVVELDMGEIVPSLAGPKRPQDRIALAEMAASFGSTRDEYLAMRGTGDSEAQVHLATDAGDFDLGHGSVVIAAITSCTNTSNPSVLVAAGLLASKAAERGLRAKPWVKTSLAPGSRVVTRYLAEAQLLEPLETLGFHVVGYGCTTCIGNSGPLDRAVEAAIDEADLVVSSVISGNRNFEGRVHGKVRASYLASPPLVVAYALAGTTALDLTSEPLGHGSDGEPVYLKDIWPTGAEIAACEAAAVKSEMFQASYAEALEGPQAWRSIEVPAGDVYAWDPDSTYVKSPPYFDGMTAEVAEVRNITGARALCLFGDSITTDHISPAGSIAADSPAAAYLRERGVESADFNSYGSRRGNHEVMMRGTFANVRIKNLLVPGVEGGVTRHLPDGEQMSIFDAAMRYRDEGTPLVILGGKEYGTGSSRDWAAKGPCLLGVRAVIVESFERIHRSNLVGMGVLPLQFLQDQSAASLGLTGEEVFDITGLAERFAEGLPTAGELTVHATDASGKLTEFQALLRIDTPEDARYYQNGGILHYVLRRLAQ
ncbi:MAG: aconitate hydratase AcnA, partial [Planctomycetota bacterium]|nr:aconitate hydratase AcnA [Planctomycetota bacterium]